MHCPNCGTKTSVEQKYCRSCGLSLEKVALIVSEQLPEQLEESLQARKNKLERLGVAALSVFGAGILGLILYGVVYKAILVQGRIWEGLGVLGFLVIIACGLLATYLFAAANDVKKVGRKLDGAQKEELPRDENTRELLPEGRIAPITSVTERTTDLLFAKKNRKPQNEE